MNERSGKFVACPFTRTLRLPALHPHCMRRCDFNWFGDSAKVYSKVWEYHPDVG